MMSRRGVGHKETKKLKAVTIATETIIDQTGRILIATDDVMISIERIDADTQVEIMIDESGTKIEKDISHPLASIMVVTDQALESPAHP